MKEIGVLGLQGDFQAHAQKIRETGHSPRIIKKPEQLGGIDGLIIPGGESTTLVKLILAFKFVEPIRKHFAEEKGVFGTCAGSILVASQIKGSSQFRFGFIDVTVERNGYGSQAESFEALVRLKGQEPPLEAVFIRAPRITAVGDEVEVWAEFDGSAVVVSQSNILVSTFHPELTNDLRLHREFTERFC